jgi:hypothetical protein
MAWRRSDLLMPLNTRHGGTEERRLTELLAILSPEDRATLLAFGEFLAARQAGAGADPPARTRPDSPREIPRPLTETVVGAIRRLSETYFMLERRDMLNDTAALMAAHVIHGRPNAEVIDELEGVFRSHYARYLERWPK